MIEGVDYSDARPSPAGLAQAGKRFAVRYGGPGTADKHIDAGEVAALHGAGIAIVANAEGTARGLIGGRATGRAWAASADLHFRALGWPLDRPIYLSADWDVQAVEWPTVREALAGAADVLGAARVGIYGGRRVIEWAQRDRAAAWFWQTYAWSGNPTVWVPGTHLQQYRNGVTIAGGDCDLNRAVTVDYGQWGGNMGRDYSPYSVPASVGDRPDSVLLADLWRRVMDGQGPYGGGKGYLLDQLDRIEAGRTTVTLTDADRAALAPVIESTLIDILGRIGLEVRPRE